MKIDFHAHHYPRAYLKRLDELGFLVREERGTYMTATEGTFRVPITTGLSDIEKHIHVMDKYGISTEVLSLPPIREQLVDAREADQLSRVVNDELAMLVQNHSSRFVGLASLPLVDVGLALDELQRAIGGLGLRGCIIPTNVGGRALDDPKFIPFFEEMNRLLLPIFIHPVPTSLGPRLEDYGLSLTLGLTHETGLAAARLAMGGVLERFRNLKIVAAHLGGVFPYLAGRLDRVTRAFPATATKIKSAPSEYLKQIYVDTISFSTPALSCAYGLLGAKRMLFGSDYPFEWGTQEEGTAAVNSLCLSSEENDRIFHKNAADLLGLPV